MKYIIGVDLGGTNLKVALLNLKYKIKDKLILNTRDFSKKEALIFAIVDSINRIIENNRLNRINILGIGLGLPGPIDVKKGIVNFFPNIPGWREVNLKKILEKRLRLPIFLDNDAKLMTLAEYNLGAAKGFRNVVCLTLGTGVGGGIIINSALYRGKDNTSGEIGHVPINAKGPHCNCGGMACLETYIGNNRIKLEAKRLFKRAVSLEELDKLSRNQNKKALAIWHRVARYLGIALAGVINLLNPDAIVIGGGVANAGKILFDKAEEVILDRAMSVPARRVKFFKAKLGNDAGLIGAAILVKKGASNS